MNGSKVHTDIPPTQFAHLSSISLSALNFRTAAASREALPWVIRSASNFDFGINTGQSQSERIHSAVNPSRQSAYLLLSPSIVEEPSPSVISTN